MTYNGQIWGKFAGGGLGALAWTPNADPCVSISTRNLQNIDISQSDRRSIQICQNPLTHCSKALAVGRDRSAYHHALNLNKSGLEMPSNQKMPFSTGTMVPSHSNVGPRATSPALLSTIKVLLVLVAQLPLLHASPLRFRARAAEEEPMPAHEPTLWIYLAVAIALVLLGGAFAGLTIALMGQVI